MSTDDESRTTRDARQEDLPSGRPVGEEDHRTLADRLTGRGEVPEHDDHTARLEDEHTAHPEDERPDDERTARPEDDRPVERRATAAEQETHGRPTGPEGHEVAPGAGPVAAGPVDTRADDTRPVDTRAAADARTDTDTRTDTETLPAQDERRRGRQPGGYPQRAEGAPDRRSVIERQKEDFGGVKIGAAFFGWLSATGLAVLLTALVAAVGAAVGVTDASLDEVTRRANADLGSVGVAGGIALLVIIVVSYYAGGYVAGRMARFNGIRQGLVVWLWAIVIAAIIAAAAAIWGSKYDILSTLNSFPRWPVDQGTLTTGGVIALVILALASLVGALLGGLAGMHFHRKIDKAGLEG